MMGGEKCRTREAHKMSIHHHTSMNEGGFAVID